MYESKFKSVSGTIQTDLEKSSSGKSLSVNLEEFSS